MALDESVQDGDAGHLSDHDTLHTLANNRLVVYVQHGATAGTARPQVAGSAAVVAWWDGSVEPSNAVDGDLWSDTSNDVVKQKQSGSFVSLGLAAHDLGGSDHNADTLANLNAKVSDATLDDSGDSRTPTAHAASHSDGGSDEVSVENLATSGADGTVPTAQSDGSLAMETPSSGSSAVFLAARGDFVPRITAGADEVDFDAVGVALAFDDTTLESGLAMTSGLPWSTFDLAIVWGAQSGNSGDVVWQPRYTDWADAASLNETAPANVTAAAPGSTDQKKTTTLVTGATYTAGNELQIRIARAAGDAADTLTGDAEIIGVLLTEG